MKHTATAAATMLDLWLGARIAALPGLTGFVKLAKATDELSFSPAAVASVRGLSPVPGRAVSGSVQWRW